MFSPKITIFTISSKLSRTKLGTVLISIIIQRASIDRVFMVIEIII